MQSSAGNGVHVLQEVFLRVRRGARGPLAAVDAHTLLVNSSASAVVSAHDRNPLWEWAQRRIGRTGVRAGTADRRPVILPSGARPTACEAVRTGTTLRGALVWLEIPRAFPSASDEWRSVREAGWSLLTASEYNVACHVARGLTNRETAAVLRVSPHTVDYHLRQIFRKLQIRSRVELARLAATRQEMFRMYQQGSPAR